jgi:hypothetical protein
VNVIRIWQTGFSEPMWIMTNLKAEDGLAIYFQHMVIEETFRDLKNLLNFHKLMNERRSLMEKLVSLILIAYAIVLVVGEPLHAQLFPEGSRKNKLYLGSFVFLKLKPIFCPFFFLRHAWLSTSLSCLSELISEFQLYTRVLSQ